MANGRFEIRSGARVIGVDGEIGRVEQLVVTPGTGMVTGLVVRKGLLLRRDIVLPAEAVEDATEDLVRVRLSVRELEQLPEYRDGDFARSPADWRSPVGGRVGEVLFRLPTLFERERLQPARSGRAEAAVGGQPIKVGQTVVCRDGKVGPLDLVLLDPASRRATHVVVRRGRLLGRDTIVPIEWARELGPDRIFLDLTRQDLEVLPEYRTDDEITADVLDLLWHRSELDPEDLRYVEARTTDGIVELRGLTRTEWARAMIEEHARRARGVLGVRNRVQSCEAQAEAIRRRARVGEKALSGHGAE